MVERQSRVVEAPPYVLGMDAVIQHECDSQEQVSLQFMDRDALLNQFLALFRIVSLAFGVWLGLGPDNDFHI